MHKSSEHVSCDVTGLLYSMPKSTASEMTKRQHGKDMTACMTHEQAQWWAVVLPLNSFPLNHCTAEAAENGSWYVTVPSPCIPQDLQLKSL